MAKRAGKGSARKATAAKPPASGAAAGKKIGPAKSGAGKAGGTAAKSAEKGLTPARGAAQPAATAAAVSPFSLMRRFAEGMDRLFTDFRLDTSPWLEFPFRGPGMEAAAWAPRVDVVEQGGKFVIRADLPGLTKNDVKVEVGDDTVSIRGERRHERETKGKGFYHSERSYGSFYRAIPLPEGVAADQATATFRNGVLEVSMPAPPRPAKGRPVAIEE